jgi:hypothetical protein
MARQAEAAQQRRLVVCTENLIRVADVMESPKQGGMIGLLCLAVGNAVELAEPFGRHHVG